MEHSPGLGHKVNLGKFKETDIIITSFSNHNAKTLDINYKGREKKKKNCKRKKKERKTCEGQQYGIEQSIDH